MDLKKGLIKEENTKAGIEVGAVLGVKPGTARIVGLSGTDNLNNMESRRVIGIEYLKYI